MTCPSRSRTVETLTERSSVPPSARCQAMSKGATAAPSCACAAHRSSDACTPAGNTAPNGEPNASAAAMP